MTLGSPPDRRRKALAVVALWLAAFGAAYALVYAAAAGNEYLQRFWWHGFLVPWTPQFAGRLALVGREVLTAFSVGYIIPDWFIQAQRYGTWLLAAVAAIGGAALIRRRAPWELVLLFGPVVLVGAASALSRYPASSRLVLFLVPAFYISVAAGAAALLASLPARRRPLLGKVLIGVALGSQLCMSVRYLLRFPRIENTREMIALLGPVARAPQVVYVHAGALPAWAFYSTDWAHPDSARLARYAALGASDGAAFENAPSRGRVVLGEGWDLRFIDGNRVELMGLPVGVWHRPKVAHAEVDVGWTENEVRRIMRATGCQGSVWVLLSHAKDADRLLLRGLAAAGGRVTFEMPAWAASLTRFEFERAESDCVQR